MTGPDDERQTQRRRPARPEGGAGDRAARLGAALRANLARRKAQARALAGAESGPGRDAAGPPDGDGTGTDRGGAGGDRAPGDEGG